MHPEGPRPGCRGTPAGAPGSTSRSPRGTGSYNTPAILISFFKASSHSKLRKSLEG